VLLVLQVLAQQVELVELMVQMELQVTQALQVNLEHQVLQVQAVQ